MPCSRSRIGARKSVGAKPVARRGLLAVNGKRSFEMGPSHVAQPSLASALSRDEMLLEVGGGHVTIDAEA